VSVPVGPANRKSEREGDTSVLDAAAEKLVVSLPTVRGVQTGVLAYRMKGVVSAEATGAATRDNALTVEFAARTEVGFARNGCPLGLRIVAAAIVTHRRGTAPRVVPCAARLVEDAAERSSFGVA